VHLYPTFFVAPLNFSLGANLYQKLLFFTILGAVNHIFKATTMKFSKKSHKGVYPFRANLYQKIPILAAVGPYFLSHNNEIWQDSADLGLPPPSQIW